MEHINTSEGWSYLIDDISKSFGKIAIDNPYTFGYKNTLYVVRLYVERTTKPYFELGFKDESFVKQHQTFSTLADMMEWVKHRG